MQMMSALKNAAEYANKEIFVSFVIIIKAIWNKS